MNRAFKVGDKVKIRGSCFFHPNQLKLIEGVKDNVVSASH